LSRKTLTSFHPSLKRSTLNLQLSISCRPTTPSEDYKAFEAAIVADYDAQSAVERELVLRLPSLLWRLRRATTMETSLSEIQADHLGAFRQAHQTLPPSREVVYALFGRADSSDFDRDPASHGIANETEAVPICQRGCRTAGCARRAAREGITTTQKATREIGGRIDGRSDRFRHGAFCVCSRPRAQYIIVV
jgi:hypothetical protein